MTINPNVNMNANPNPPAPKAKGRRLWFLVLVALLAGGGLLATRLQTELDGNLKAWAYSAITLLGGILFVIWFLLLSRFPGRTRLIAFGVLVLAIVGVRFAVRVDGTVDGSGLPKLAWKWSQGGHRQFANPAPASTAEASVATADVVEVQGMDVPQFYGPNRDGVVTGASLARDWNAHPPKELWRQPIGEGWSAFAVVGGRAFTQEQRGDDEMVTCYELLTGRLLWSHVNKVRFTQWQGGTGPRATPTVVDGKVYAYGATGILDCLDARNGARIWSRDVLKEHDIHNI
ncbi:MAG: PQQ-binding-like beta-propeller repeat protein, partial [Verrucomicrobium sp.]